MGRKSKAAAGKVGEKGGTSGEKGKKKKRLALLVLREKETPTFPDWEERRDKVKKKAVFPFPSTNI